MLTGEQVKAARAMLRLNQRQFAELTHTTLSTVKRMENTRGPLTNAIAIIEATRTALEDAGVEFIPAGPFQGNGGPGIRLRGEILLAEESDTPVEKAPTPTRPRAIAHGREPSKVCALPIGQQRL